LTAVHAIRPAENQTVCVRYQGLSPRRRKKA
jgi:hypothetical protein